MARYEPRHGFLYGEPEDPTDRRRLIAVRVGLALVLVGAALVFASVFTDKSPLKGRVAASVHVDKSHTAGKGTSAHGKPGTSGGSGGASGHGGTGTTGTSGKGTSGKGAGRDNGRPVTRGAHGGGSGSGPTPTTSAGTASAPAQDIGAPAGFGPLLRHLWVAADPGGVGLTAADVQSTYPGSVYYASQPSLGQYWSMARFLPGASALAGTGTPAGKARLALFAEAAVFFKAPGQAWAFLGEVSAGSCPGDVPGVVLQAWRICTVGS